MDGLAARGDRAADGVSDLVTLHTVVAGFKEGSQTKRELTTVLGATTVDITEPYWKLIKQGAIQEKEIAEALQAT